MFLGIESMYWEAGVVFSCLVMTVFLLLGQFLDAFFKGENDE